MPDLQDTKVPTAQEPRINYSTVSPDAVRAQMALETYVRHSSLEAPLVELIKLRASYLNGCAYCVDMHTKDARLAGETEQRLYAVGVWHETPFFTPRERAALAYTDAATLIAGRGISDELYDSVREHFSEREMLDLVMAVIAINGWNRLAITCRTPVGSHVANKRATSPAARTPSAP
jgi:AhpD family alkylhydroperoxidase